ncbi:PIN/TRAM domain-containing protein [Paenibacillus wenxiniae]|uniref:PIN/TRAM domain-containing protein n=1 Tax=Paenibacillus wenxiniae TaxID=1636843 RepID=A0ABW4RCX2_9BACL
MLDQLLQWNNILAQGEGSPLRTVVEIALILIAALLLSLIIRRLLVILEKRRLQLLAMPIDKVLAAACGLLLGLVLGWLGASIIDWWDHVYAVVRTFLMLTLGYLGMRIGYERAEELQIHRQMVTKGGAIDTPTEAEISQTPSKTTAEALPTALPMISILDANVAIDGRIEGVIECGFMSGIVIVPDFIVQELQWIADSADTLRRQRGKKGLDTLTCLHTLPGIELEVAATHYSDTLSADERLVQLAAARKAVLITHDRNLEQIAGLHGIRVLSINRLAALIKPQLLAGELLHIQITRAGKEAGQGIAHLEDGTMIVVEQGREYIGSNVEVVITSVLQTANGKMIFARPHD